MVNNLPQCGLAWNGASSFSIRGNNFLTSSHSCFQVKCIVTESWFLQGLSQSWSAAIVLISVINKCGPICFPIFCMARMASTALRCGTKYSDCNSLPLLGVKPILKCGSLSYQGPGLPICGVQFSAESSIIG